jgi:hypothetical protein
MIDDGNVAAFHERFLAMAYNNQGSRFGGKSAAPAQSSPRPATGGVKEKIASLLRTGLFKPKSDKSKAVASVATTIDSDIRAGQRVYIDLYQNSEEEVAAGKPLYVVMIKEAPEQKRA